jgi:hypothetical protein
MAGMNAEHQRLWISLQQQGLVEGAPPAPGEAGSPWYILVFMGFFGWLAALFLFLAIALLFFFDLELDWFFESPLLLWTIGLLLIGVAFWLLRSAASEFVRHMALAFSLAGQGFVAWGSFGSADAMGATLLITGFQMLLAVFMPDFIHRVFSTCVAALGLLVFVELPLLNVVAGGVVLVFTGWVWLHEFQFPRMSPALRAWGYGGGLALVASRSEVALGLNWSVSNGMLDTLPTIYGWLATLLEGLAAVYVVYSVCQRLKTAARVQILALCALTALVLASAVAPGLLVCMMVIVLGQTGSNTLLKGIGIAGLLFYASAFYYQLHATLMVKFQILLATGLLLLAVRWLMLRLVNGQAGENP